MLAVLLALAPAADATRTLAQQRTPAQHDTLGSEPDASKAAAEAAAPPTHMPLSSSSGVIEMPNVSDAAAPAKPPQQQQPPAAAPAPAEAAAEPKADAAVKAAADGGGAAQRKAEEQAAAAAAGANASADASATDGSTDDSDDSDEVMSPLAAAAAAGQLPILLGGAYVEPDPLLVWNPEQQQQQQDAQQDASSNAVSTLPPPGSAGEDEEEEEPAAVKASSSGSGSSTGNDGAGVTDAKAAAAPSVPQQQQQPSGADATAADGDAAATAAAANTAETAETSSSEDTDSSSSSSSSGGEDAFGAAWMAPAENSAHVEPIALGTPGPCTLDVLNNWFAPTEPATLPNSYLMLLLARYAYPTALGITATSERAQEAYRSLLRRKFTALGAQPQTVRFVDVDESGGSPFAALLGASGPEAHAVVFASQEHVFVTFRGLTNAEGALSENARFAPVEGVFGEAVLPVHQGFYAGFDKVWPAVADAVEAAAAATQQPAAARVFVTGHSLGAAHAAMAAMRLLAEGRAVGGVYAYGLPRFGQQLFVDTYASSPLAPLTVSWWNELDVVPNMLPPLIGTAPYARFPSDSLYRIWQGECGKAAGATTEPSPLGEGRARLNLADHTAYAYLGNMQECLLRAEPLQGSKCQLRLVTSLM